MVTMAIDPPGARAFLTTHGRLLDRRRLDHLLGIGSPGAVLAALDGYRNVDGGYGWGLEPDLRAPESQPAAAMQALEIFAEATPPSEAIRSLFDWLERHTLAQGALPFAFPIENSQGCAPFFVGVDASVASLMMTAQVAAPAQRLVTRHPALADHPWPARASAYCVETIAAMTAPPHAYELLFALRFLDVVAGAADAESLIDHLGSFLPEGGSLPVEGGADDERLHPLDFCPRRSGRLRRLFSDEIMAADRIRLERLQEPDGGWPVDFHSYSPAATLEWRGLATVAAVAVLASDAG